MFVEELKVEVEDYILAALGNVQSTEGRCWRYKIWLAWYDGNYQKRGLSNLSQPLQLFRNLHGPKALYKIKNETVRKAFHDAK